MNKFNQVNRYVFRNLLQLIAICLFIFAITGCGGGDDKPPTIELRVSMDGTGSGRVISSAGGIFCELDCSEEYTEGQEIVLAAMPYTGSSFTGWSGGGCSGMGTCTINMENALTVNASFTLDDTGISNLITPYVNESDMLNIREAFSTVNTSPWGFVHDGIDFFPAENLMPYRAVCAGRVFKILLFDEQVTVLIACNSRFLTQYNFETQAPGTGQEQLDNILVVEGQAVAQGDVIGYLYAPNTDAHVHFSLSDNVIPVCPATYFTSDARDSVVNLLQNFYPGETICYGDPAVPHQLLTPYVNETDMLAIRAGFSSENSFSPWEYINNGLDIYPQGNLRPFQAVCPGSVDTSELQQDTNTMHWQVKVLIRCDDYVPDQVNPGYFIPYYTEYIFETGSSTQLDGQAQLTEISVSEGQAISSGEMIGSLYLGGEGAHVQFSIVHLGPPGFQVLDVPLCPEPHFSDAARYSVMNLLRGAWANAGMCYQI